MMPDLTGPELYRELLLVSPLLAKRMIFVTGGAFTASTEEFLGTPGREHIDKPFDPEHLRAIMQRILSCGGDESPTAAMIP